MKAPIRVLTCALGLVAVSGRASASPTTREIQVVLNPELSVCSPPAFFAFELHGLPSDPSTFWVDEFRILWPDYQRQAARPFDWGSELFASLPPVSPGDVFRFSFSGWASATTFHLERGPDDFAPCSFEVSLTACHQGDSFNGSSVLVGFSAFAAGTMTVLTWLVRRPATRKAPGSSLTRSAECLLRPATVELVLAMIADMQFEYFEALQAARPHRARWLLVLHYIAIARALTVDRALGALVGYVFGVIRAGKP